MTTTTIDFTIKDLDGAVVPLTSFQIASGRLNTGEIPDVMPATVTFTTDSAGQASVTLTVTESPYYLSKLDGSTDQIISYKFFVPTTSSTSLSAELLYVDLSRRSLQWNDKSVAALIEAKIVALNAANQALLAVSVLGSVSTLSTNLANIIAVGTNIASVNTAAGAVTNIATVAGATSSITAVAPYVANIASVAVVTSEIASVAGSIASVNAVAPYVANIATIAPVVTEVATVAGIASNVSAVAGNATNINTVASNTTAIATVSTDIASVNTVATNMTDIQAAVDIVADIATVIPYVANIATVATNITPVVAVGNNIDNINDVVALEDEIVVIAANISNLSNAAAAVTQAVDAQKELYVAGTNYTKNTSTSLTLTYFPAKSNSVKVFFDGVYKNSDTWTRVGKTIVFTSTIGADNVEITYEVPSSYVGLSTADTAVITAAEASATNSAANALQWSIDAALYASNALATATQAVDGIKELFLAGSNYTQNVSTVINLGYTPAKINTVKVFMDGVYQNSNTYSLSGTVLTFSSAIISDTVEIQYEVPSQFVGLSVADQAILDAATAAAQASANAAALSFDSFDDRYLGAKTVAPTVDNDGSALITGAMYFDSTVNKMFVRTSLSTWVSSDAASGVSYTPTGNVAATNVQSAITELDTEKVSVTSLATSTGAAAVGFNPASGIAATNVQSAIVEVVTDLSASTGSTGVGYMPAGSGATATTVSQKLLDIKTPSDVGDPTVVIDIKPAALLPATQGMIFGESSYSAASIGSGSIIIGGKTGATANRLPAASGAGTGELRMIVGGYDNEISSTVTDDGLACAIVGSHHSSISGDSDHCGVSFGSYNTISFGGYSGILSGTLNSISGTYDALGNRNSVISGGASNSINGTNSAVVGGNTNVLRGTGSVIGGFGNSAGQVSRYDYGAVFGNLNTVNRDYNLVAGYSNTQTRDYGFIVGRNNSVAGDFSTASGRSASCTLAYATAFGFGVDNTQAIAQRVRYPLVRTTTDATPVSLLTVVQGSVGFDAVTNTAVTAKARVRATNGTDMKVWDLDFAFVRTGVTTTLYNTATVVGASVGAALWTAVFSGANDCRITATGEAAKSIKWFADVDYMITPLT